MTSFREELEDKTEEGRSSLPKPQEIKDTLDDYVIGQQRAKESFIGRSLQSLQTP